jgi:hypothetical protein
MKTLGWTGIALWAAILTATAGLGAMLWGTSFDFWNTVGLALVFVWGANMMHKLAEHIDRLEDRIKALENLTERHDCAIRAIPSDQRFP